MTFRAIAVVAVQQDRDGFIMFPLNLLPGLFGVCVHVCVVDREGIMVLGSGALVVVISIGGSVSDQLQ